MMLTSSLKTDDFHGYNVKYSPIRPDYIACATSENYGIAGRGRLFVIKFHNSRTLQIVESIDWMHGLFDVTWSEINEKLLVTSCGDGSVQLWDFVKSQRPVSYYKIHSKENSEQTEKRILMTILHDHVPSEEDMIEVYPSVWKTSNDDVYSVDWNPKNTYSLILTASWDHTVKLWDPFAAKEVAACTDHTDQLYEAKFCPLYPSIFSSVSADGTLRLWDMRHHDKAVNTIPHGNEVLCCDWSKSDGNILAVGTTDGKIIGWDTKNMKKPIFVLVGHEYAIRRLKFSHISRGTLASVSYDFTTRFWNWAEPYAVDVQKVHTEFVYGLDFNPSRPSEVCDCAWDSLVNVYTGVL